MADPVLFVRTQLFRALARADHERAERARRAPVAGSLLRLVERRLAGGPIAVAPGLAHRMLFGPEGLPIDHPQAGEIVRGLLEMPVQEALRRTLAPGGRLLDVGANLGFFTVLGARLVGPAGHVDAFEPVPANAAAIRANVGRNGMDGRAVVHEQAVAASSGRAALHVVGEASWSHLADRGRHPGTTETIDVDVVAIDELVAAGALHAPDVVKLDVEGSEIAALRGAARLLAEHRPVLVVETHATNAELADLLDDAGYVHENLDGPEPLREAGPIHVLARPR